MAYYLYRTMSGVACWTGWGMQCFMVWFIDQVFSYRTGLSLSGISLLALMIAWGEPFNPQFHVIVVMHLVFGLILVLARFLINHIPE